MSRSQRARVDRLATTVLGCSGCRRWQEQEAERARAWVDLQARLPGMIANLGKPGWLRGEAARLLAEAARLEAGPEGIEDAGFDREGDDEPVPPPNRRAPLIAPGSRQRPVGRGCGRCRTRGEGDREAGINALAARVHAVARNLRREPHWHRQHAHELLDRADQLDAIGTAAPPAAAPAPA
jgi:hypothetical protein